MIKLIFFDFDGVIAESVDIKTEAFRKLFEHEGKEIARQVVEYHLANTGVSRYEKIKYIYAKILNRSLRENEFELLCNKFSDLVVDSVVAAPYVRGAKEFLENHSTKYKCFVVSATPQEEICKIIKRRNMGRFFKAIYGAPLKKSDAVRKVLVQEKVTPADAVYIGDAMSDYLAAQNNSVVFIARTTSNSSLFLQTNCLKTKDLTSLGSLIKGL